MVSISAPVGRAANPQAAMRQARRLQVVVDGQTEQGRRTRTVISHHATEHSAFTRVIEIMRQWSDSHGATPVGTTVSIIDSADGGTLFFARYLGFEPDLLSGGNS